MSRGNSGKRRTRVELKRLAPEGVCLRTGKMRWPTRAGARQHLRSLKAANKTWDASRLATYKCRCGAWHVGHRLKENPTDDSSS